MEDIIFGVPEQVLVVQRAKALWTLLQNDPRFCFQGRTVSLTQFTDNVVAQVIALVRLQGYASCHFVPRDRAAKLLSQYDDAGLQPLQWEQYWGRETAISQSRAFVDGYQPPDGLRLQTVQPDTPDTVIHAIGEMSIRAGVLPPPGSAMRNQGPKGVFQYVETAEGRIVACGGAFMSYSADGPRADEAFWGMLAADKDWRGQRLACWVGAQVIVDMADRYGARGFSSGVKADNPSSQAMCNRLGVRASDYVYAGATNPQTMGKVSVTR